MRGGTAPVSALSCHRKRVALHRACFTVDLYTKAAFFRAAESSALFESQIVNRMENPATLPRAGLLADASDRTLRELAEIAQPVSYDKGAILMEQGEEGDSLYVVQSGRLEVSVVSSDGRKLLLEMFQRGDVIGEIALLDPGIRTATITAADDANLLRISRPDLIRAVELDPLLGLDIAAMAARRLRWVSQQLHEHVFLPLPQRLARKLLHLCKGSETVLAMSQSDLAEFVGATREAVSKTLSGWRTEGIVDLGRQKVILVDREALETLAQVDTI